MIGARCYDAIAPNNSISQTTQPKVQLEVTEQRRSRMKYLKISGIVWGLVYLVVGALKSFTLNSLDFWSGVAFLGATFLLPLPIALAAIWLPRIAGKVLFGCFAISMGIVAYIIISDRQFSLGSWMGFIAVTLLFNVPHLLFGAGYIRLGRASKNADSGNEGSSVGVA